MKSKGKAFIIPVIMASFSAFNLSERMVSALNKMGYQEPSPVQSSIIPRALRGESLLCQSPTGSGKTHSYLIPIIERIDVNLPRLQALVVCPSRELARQVYEFAKPFEKYYQRLKVRLFTSEEDKSNNQAGLTSAPQLLIGTPGRLKDILIDEYALDLHGIKTLVLDEADMLMEYGYFDDVDAIYTHIGSTPQVLVFSATLQQGLKQQLAKYIESDFLFSGGEDKTSGDVSHHLVDIKHVGNEAALKNFLKIRNPYLCLVFASKKADVRAIYESLRQDDYAVTMYSGDLETRERRATLKKIKENRYQIIVCSDLLSRGIDIQDVTDVISIDLPSELEYYYHRAGRSGRFGKKGDSWVFYNADNTKRAKLLLEQGVKFDYYTLGKDELSVDPVGLAKKKKYTTKKPFEGEEATEIKKLKARNKTDKVKPAYKKKLNWEVERVKNKYRRKAIQKSVNRAKARKYSKENGDE